MFQLSENLKVLPFPFDTSSIFIKWDDALNEILNDLNNEIED